MEDKMGIHKFFHEIAAMGSKHPDHMSSLQDYNSEEAQLHVYSSIANTQGNYC